VILAAQWEAISAVAQAVAAFGALLVFYVAVLQRTDARDSAEAALRAAAAAERGVELQAGAQTDQFRLLTYPAVGVEMTTEGTQNYVRVYNPGQYPALDVDLVLLHILDERDETLEAFAARCAVPEHCALVAKAGVTTRGAYAVQDHVYYSSIGPRRQVKAVTAFPAEPRSLALLLQYRDVQGRNYAHVLSAFWSTDDGRYTTLIEYEGDRLQESTRLDLFMSMARGTNLPSVSEDMQRNFIDYWDHSIPAAYLQSGRPEVDDRGVWSELSFPV
jgi:hypothetical protein